MEDVVSTNAEQAEVIARQNQTIVGGIDFVPSPSEDPRPRSKSTDLILTTILFCPLATYRSRSSSTYWKKANNSLLG